ncbi:MAG: non-heme chloroperoxidase [Gammaproteobacteria bacterium]|jgi:pimeloyl-ACP methyl ester carboxylesterase|nr:non-heme chloroperoxidase [Gammaproteobacteria bacterium]
MNRRTLLTNAAATFGGAALIATSGGHASATTVAQKSTAVSYRGRSIILTRDGTELFYRDWGTDAPVIFLAGWALSSDFWAYQMGPLSDAGFRCIAYDRRGHGRSSDPGRGFDYDSLADDLADVLNALDLTGVTLVAHSMGLGEAIRYLFRHGSQRVTRLALVGPILPLPTKTPDNPEGTDPAVWEGFRRNVLQRDFPKWLDDNAGPFFVADTSAGMVSWVKHMMLECSMKAVVECNRTITTTDFRGQLPQLRMPTIVIHGDRDVSAPLDLTGRRVASLIPGARLEIYPGAPHGLPLTHSAQLNRDLLEFMTPRPQ